MNANILISIIISTRDKPWDLLSRTLDSILSSASKDFEIIVVDQNFGGDIRPGIRSDPKYAGIVYINSDDIGLSKGRNSGIKRAKGNWLLFFDDDAIMPSDTLSTISSALYERADEPMIYYGEILTLETNRPYLKKSLTMGSRIGLLNFDSVCSIALLFNARVMLETGLFDERLGAGAEYGAGEESDIILRALKHGFRIERLDGFRVYHREAGTSDLSRRESYGMGAGALYKKHIFSSPRFFSALFSRLILELSLRALLILRYTASADLRQYHLNYMRGFIKGLRRFRQ